MARPLTIVVVLLGLTLTAWAIASWNDEVPIDSLDAEHGTNRPSPTPADLRTDQAAPSPKLPAESTETGQREALDPPKSNATFEASPADEAIRVSVLLADTGTPAVGAEVWYLRMSDFLARMTPAERDTMRRERWDITMMFEKFGYRARVDAACIATIRKDKRGVVVMGRREDLFGQLIIESKDPAPIDGWELRLRPDCTVQVRVVDSKDARGPRVTIAFSQSSSGSPSSPQCSSLGTQGPSSCRRSGTKPSASTSSRWLSTFPERYGWPA